MELFLNLVWALVTLAMGGLWLRYGLREGSPRRMQLLSLAVLLLLLFPVISVSDDLLALQNAAEVDSCLKRDKAIAAAHAVLPAVAGPADAVACAAPLGKPRWAAADDRAVPAAASPCLTAIENRPPPAA